MYTINTMDEFEQEYYDLRVEYDSVLERIDLLREAFELFYEKYRDTIPELDDLEELLGNLY